VVVSRLASASLGSETLECHRWWDRMGQYRFFCFSQWHAKSPRDDSELPLHGFEPKCSKCLYSRCVYSCQPFTLSEKMQRASMSPLSIKLAWYGGRGGGDWGDMTHHLLAEGMRPLLPSVLPLRRTLGLHTPTPPLAAASAAASSPSVPPGGDGPGRPSRRGRHAPPALL